MVSQIMDQMKPGAGVTKELKVTDPMEWVRFMNSLKSAAEEIVLKEKVYC